MAVAAPSASTSENRSLCAAEGRMMPSEFAAAAAKRGDVRSRDSSLSFMGGDYWWFASKLTQAFEPIKLQHAQGVGRHSDSAVRKLIERCGVSLSSKLTTHAYRCPGIEF